MLTGFVCYLANCRLTATDFQQVSAALQAVSMGAAGTVGRLLAVQSLIRGRQVAWTIDPEAFARFQVETVPVFVLTRQGARSSGCGDATCFAQDDIVRLAGDVSIGYALDAIDRLAPQFRDDVASVRAGQ